MKIKNQLERLTKISEALHQFRSHNRDHSKSSIENTIHSYFQKIEEFGYNSTLMSDFLVLLQLAESPSLLEQFNLEDISKTFDALIKSEPKNLELILEATYFEWSVMNNKEKATFLANKGQQLLNDYNNEFQTLISEINEE